MELCPWVLCQGAQRRGSAPNNLIGSDSWETGSSWTGEKLDVEREGGTSNAGDVGSIPGQGTKIPHAKGLLSPRATNTTKTATKEKPKRHDEEPAWGNWDPAQPKINAYNF